VPPPRPARSRLAVAVLAAAMLAGACAPDAPRCPGQSEGTFLLRATRATAACSAGEPAGGYDTLYPPQLDFTATVTFASEGSGAAVCTTRPGAEPLTGTHQGDLVSVTLRTSGAVLGACGATCGVSVTQELTGTLVRGPTSGDATGFTGTLTDRAEVAGGGACAPCTPPCSATYALALAPASP